MTSVWTVLLVGVLTGSATLVGGNVVLRYNRALPLLLGFSSGAVIGVALFDLLPEALDLAGEQHSHLSITTAAAAGFVLYFLMGRTAGALTGGTSGHRHFAPASLTLHSLLDGLGIGLAFHISSAAGIVVAAAVLAHDSVDGANTVILSLAGGGGRPRAKWWLAADAIAPLAGIALASVLVIPNFALALLLGVFAGFFLYIGASELLPLSHVRRPQLSTLAATVAGMAFIYAVIGLANI